MIRAEVEGRPRLAFNAAEIAKLCDGRVVRRGAAPRDGIGSICTDTRQLQPGDCFLALSGERFDGHDYLGEAVARGVAGVIVSRPIGAGSALPGAPFVVKVPDTLVALQHLAAAHRARRSARIVGITGSCGKTSTKDMLGHVLSAAMPTVRSPRSFNNSIGVPLSLLLIEPRTRAAVVEIGSSAPGEVAHLSGLADPDIAIVTCVAEAHLEGLGSVGGVAREKAGLVTGLREGAVAILNGDDEACRAMAGMTKARSVKVRLGREADWFATDARFHGMGTTFKLQGERPVTLPMLGTHSVYNALFTIAAAVELGMALDAVLQGLCSLPPSSRRLEPKRIGDITIFDDTYNMNPASARAGLRALSGLQKSGRKIVVFGGMLELGERSAELHRELGAEIARSGIDILLAVGEEAEPIVAGALAAGMAAGRVRHLEHAGSAEDELVALLEPEDMVLCKASRRFELDRLVDGLAGRLRGGARASAPKRGRAHRALAGET